MIIIGAGGLAKELVLSLEENQITDFAFFDNISLPQNELLFNQYPILHNYEEVALYWKQRGRCEFHIGIGNPILRKRMARKFEELGGKLVSLISTRSVIGHHGVLLGDGVTIMQQAIISNSARIGKGGLVYYNAAITHDVEISEFCEISPGATLLGGCKLEECTHIGSGAIILPDVHVGTGVIVAAGSVVKNDVPDNCLVAGVPATIKKRKDNF